MKTEKWVFGFNELDAVKGHVGDDWDAVRGLLGGKGANLAEMNLIGVPVPAGFTITRAATSRTGSPAPTWIRSRHRCPKPSTSWTGRSTQCPALFWLTWPMATASRCPS